MIGHQSVLTVLLPSARSRRTRRVPIALDASGSAFCMCSIGGSALISWGGDALLTKFARGDDTLPARLRVGDQLCEVRGCLLVDPIGRPGRLGLWDLGGGLRTSVKVNSGRWALLSLNLRGLLEYPCFALPQCGPATGQDRLHAGWSPLQRTQQWGISFFAAGQFSRFSCAAPPHRPQVGVALHTRAIWPNLKQEKHWVGRRPSSYGSQSQSSASSRSPLSQSRLASLIEATRRTRFVFGLGPGRPLVFFTCMIFVLLALSMSAISLFLSKSLLSQSR